MTKKRAAIRLRVDGMSCASCEQRIQRAVGAIPGVGRVTASAALSEVMVYCDADQVSRETIGQTIAEAGYSVRGGSADPGAGTAPSRSTGVYRFLGLVAVIAAVYFLLKHTVGFTFLPAVSQSMGYGLIFVVGLLTSLHCIAMCGGIVLSQGVRRQENEAPVGAPSAPRVLHRLLPNLAYNAGRVVSYTVIGGVVGALGSVLSLSTTLKGLMPVIAGAFMLFLGVRMLGIFPWLSRLTVRFPGLAGRRLHSAASGRGPFIVGLLNGLMPCGPLQTMQVYALGTGSFMAGALSMFLFSLGTVPLLLGFGAVSSLLSAKFNRGMLKASGVLVVALGLIMFTRGMSLFGVSVPALTPQTSGSVAVAKLVGSAQQVQTSVQASSYQPFIVQKGVPVKWTVSVKAADLNSCNGSLVVPEYGIRKRLVPGDNLIEFTPDREGTIAYTCWMGMITSSIRIVPDLAVVTAADLSASASGSISSAFPPRSAGGCCGPVPQRFANGRIPTDTIQVAKRTDGGQVADVAVNAGGYTPAVIVMQKGVKGKVRFEAQSLSACNDVVSFPEYRGALDLSQGQLETPFLDISSDFRFQCGMGMLHGYVKVVDDVSKVDLNAVRAEVAAIHW